jgi:hypothetical protein
VHRSACMIWCIVMRMSVRMNILMEDDLAARLRTASGDKLGAYIARAVRRQLLEDELAALSASTKDTDWAADAEQAGEDVMFGRAS